VVLLTCIDEPFQQHHLGRHTMLERESLVEVVAAKPEVSYEPDELGSRGRPRKAPLVRGLHSLVVSSIRSLLGCNAAFPPTLRMGIEKRIARPVRLEELSKLFMGGGNTAGILRDGGASLNVLRSVQEPIHALCHVVNNLESHLAHLSIRIRSDGHEHETLHD